MTRNVALIYVRVSRLDEDESARKVSPDVQRSKALALRELEGLTLETFEDLDISGKSATNRPHYQRMLARLGPDIRYVVAYDLSRLTRGGRSDTDDLLQATRENGVLLIDSMNGAVLHPDRPRDKMVARMQGVVNQNYIDELSEKVHDALAMKVERGETVGPPPLGYRRSREILPNGKIARVWTEPDPDVAPIVQLIFREYATGLYSLKTLARKLNADKVAKPVRTDIKPGRGTRHGNTPLRASMWTADVLKDILNNRRYVGKIPRNDGTEHTATFAPLIDEATWSACERRRIAGRQVRLSGTRRASPYLLSGVLRCRCEATMTGERRPADRSHGVRNHYLCSRRRTVGKEACDQPYLPQERLEGELLEVLRAIALPKGVAEAVDAAVAAMQGSRGRRSRQASLKTIEERQGRINEMYEMGRYDRAEYDAKCAALDAQRTDVAASTPQPLFVRQRTMLTTLVKDWEHVTLDERKKVVASIFETITADPTADVLLDCTPRESWKDYVRAVVPATKTNESTPSEGGSERKTGVKHADVVTARLVQDERGWLRLAG